MSIEEYRRGYRPEDVARMKEINDELLSRLAQTGTIDFEKIARQILPYCMPQVTLETIMAVLRKQIGTQSQNVYST